MKKTLIKLLSEWLVILVMIIGSTARMSEAPLPSQHRSPQVKSQTTAAMAEANNTDDQILDLIQKTLIGIPIEGRHAVEQHTVSTQQQVSQRWHKRMHRLLCVNLTHHLNQQYKLTGLIHQHFFTLRHSHGDDIYGRCQMRC